MDHPFRQHLVTSNNDSHFDAALELYQSSFPQYEQRTLDNLIKTLSHPDFRFRLFLNGQNELIGLLNSWHAKEFIYVEHFAVSPHFRNGGIGKSLLNQLTREHPGKVILEIDPVEDEISNRRFHFYLRNGFVSNEEYDYIHPPYKKGDAPYPLLVLSHMEKLPRRLYELFEEYHHTTVVEPINQR